MLAGAGAYDLYVVMQAFRTPNANPGGRVGALLELWLGSSIGPQAAVGFIKAQGGEGSLVDRLRA